MNNAYQDILKLLNGCTSQKPMTYNDLVNKSELSIGTLSVALDRMANQIPALINRCEVTKLGVKQMLIWPTAVINKVNWGDFAINTQSRPALAPPRRNENLLNKESLMTDQINAASLAITAAPVELSINNKPKALLMLEFIEKNPNCTGSMIRKAADAGTVGSYLNGYIERNEIIKEKHGPREVTYRLKDGLTVEMIYIPPRGQRGLQNAKVEDETLINTQPDEVQSATAPHLVPLNLKESFVADMRAEEKNTVDITALALEKTEAIEQPFGPFRFAFTSDSCLLIYGISPEPIELKKPQVMELFDFVGADHILLHRK